MEFLEKVSAIQQELKVPKLQFNSFGKYKFRSCEDILENAKKVCASHKTVLNLSDNIVNLGDRFYVEATATLYDLESDKSIQSKASARESIVKKGMDESQITGTASSYARKYALNGLFCIDDTKDADTDEFTKQTKEEPTQRVYKCWDCGKEFTDAKGKTAEHWYRASQEMNADGKARCSACMKKLKEKNNETV